MKHFFRKIFSPILTFFESGNEPFIVKPLSRKILIAIGILFLLLDSIVINLSYDKGEPGFLVPIVVFSGVALIALVIGVLGNDRAVAKIWGNR